MFLPWDVDVCSFTYNKGLPVVPRRTPVKLGSLSPLLKPSNLTRSQQASSKLNLLIPTQVTAEDRICPTADVVVE
jgi:hypothetical protein